jgi:anti-sigma factor RsiW
VLSCNEVLARHSEYLDGEMTSVDLGRWRAHLDACPLCARYDRILRKGVRLLAETPYVEPDPSFKLHLRYRIADEERRLDVRPATLNAAASVSVAAMLALAAWLPIMLVARANESVPTSTAPTAANTDLMANEIAWHGGYAVSERRSHERSRLTLQHNSSGASLIDRGYSPLIVESPTAPPSYTRVSFSSYTR